MLKCANCDFMVGIGIPGRSWFITILCNVLKIDPWQSSITLAHTLKDNGYFLCKACVGDQWFGKGEEK